MVQLLLVLQFALAALITVVVLLQKSSSIGLGAYSGSNESLFGAKGPASFLAKATFCLAVIFVVNTLALGYLYSKKSQSSVLDHVNKESLVPTVPASSLLDQDQNRSFESLVPAASAPKTDTTSQGDNNVTQ